MTETTGLRNRRRAMGTLLLAVAMIACGRRRRHHDIMLVSVTERT